MAAEGRRQIEAVVRGLDRVSERVVTKITIDLHRGLTRRTPVDTGWARANWVPRVGSPQPTTVGSRTDAGGIGESRAAAAAGLAQVLAYKLAQGLVYVTNNVPYIRFLNAGHSRQAPAGYVQDEIAKVVRDRSFVINIGDI